MFCVFQVTKTLKLHVSFVRKNNYVSFDIIKRGRRAGGHFCHISIIPHAQNHPQMSQKDMLRRLALAVYSCSLSPQK